MHATALVFVTTWAAFWIYWLGAAFSTARKPASWWGELGVTALIAVIVALLVRLRVFSDDGVRTDPWRTGPGLALLAVGLGFAIWARVHIGRNWGAPMSRKADPELVTSGPYRLVRHPIYSGILVAGLGTALALGRPWLVAVLLAGVYFVWSAAVEERHLARTFPDTYPAYKRSTKMLVPFVL